MRRSRFLALVLAAAVLLGGCSVNFAGYFQGLGALIGGRTPVEFENMAYTRPDMAALETALEQCAFSAQGTDTSRLEADIWAYFGLYYDFYTNLSLAQIGYSTDLRDLYWSEEYDYCLARSGEVDAGLDRLYRLLAQSPHRDYLEQDGLFGQDFFDGYEEESVWDEAFIAMMEEEAGLISRYYELSGEALEQDIGTVRQEAAALYAQLIALRQEMARHMGYESYQAFAYDLYYARDYTPAQEAEYLAQVQTLLVPLYRSVSEGNGGQWVLPASSEAQTLDYIRRAAEAMGGLTWDAFQAMEEGSLYDIRFSQHKYDSSFEVYLYSYDMPYVFVNPDGSIYDQLVFAHEFGHFCNDYASYGSGAGIDVQEVFSQGLEYLSLIYGEAPEALAQVKMLDSLKLYVEQGAYADFERQAYQLTGAELTAENLMALFGEVGTAYGFDTLGFAVDDFVTIPHFFTNPMYIFSYVVSNDAAMQLYQLELEEPGAGLLTLEEHYSTMEVGILAFLECAGLESPFAPGRLEEVRDALAQWAA